ncbi:MAG: hypothetical protein DRO01_00795 [Thermoproteota archaeon]|nr:MAG: hypothetical protein DRO01_00795 [Candidatus Korarchaeota archaeon]
MTKSLALALLLLLTPAAVAALEPARGVVVQVTVDGTITQGVAEYIEEALDYAESVDAVGVVISLNTNGGFLEATQDIVLAIRESEVPVAVYVPPGGRAFSAGSIVLMAADHAGMGPGSAVGAAEPRPYDEKVANSVASWLRSLAESAGRNATAAEAFVTENLALSAEEALELGVIEHVAESLDEFLVEIGWPAPAQEVRPSPRTSIVILITEPLHAWALVILGGLLLLAGLSHPTFVMEGVGTGMLVLGLAGMGLMGVGLAAAALMLAGVVTMFLELKTGHGVLALTGAVMTAIGLMMVYRSSPLLSAGAGVGAAVAGAVVASGIVGFYLYKIRETLRLKRGWGDLSQLVGRRGVVKRAIEPRGEGVVLVGSELWTALSESGEGIEEGEAVEVVGVEGFKLVVRRVR